MGVRFLALFTLRRIIMHTKILVSALAAFLLISAAAFAADGKVTISSPSNGATLNASDKVMVTYDALLGPTGDHLHLYLDGKRIDVLRQAKGSTEVGTLSPGKHHICVEENTKAHVSTGVEGCVDVTVK
jgi:hypothetical protein